MKNKKVWKQITALLVSAILLFPATIVSAAGADWMTDENGFKVVNGELQEYKGDAKEVVIPDGVTSIAAYAFYNKSVTSITIPDSVVSYEHWTFEGISSLESLKVSANNPNYSSEDGILYNKDKTILIHCPKRKSGTVTIPNSVVSMGEHAFSGCNELNNIIIPDSVTSIGNSAFFAISLTNITIPNSVTSIGENAFATSLLTSVTIPDSVTSIGKEAFFGCPKLEKVTIPDSVTSIGLAAFMACHSLKSVAIPKNAKLGPRAFMKCTKLEKVTIPDSVTSIGKEAFLACRELTIFGKAGSYAQKYAKKNDIPFSTEKPKNRQTLSGIKDYSKTYGDKSFKLNVKLTKGNGVLSYKSSDTKVAKVDNKGNVTIKGTGIATITVTAKQTSKYNTATARIMVNIRPVKPKAPMLSAQGNQINASWKADKNVTGYEIQYSTDRNFKNKKVTKIATVKNRKVTSTTLKNVTKGKKYYVRIRSYKNAKISGKTQKIYSAWGGAKNIKP